MTKLQNVIDSLVRQLQQQPAAAGREEEGTRTTGGEGGPLPPNYIIGHNKKEN